METSIPYNGGVCADGDTPERMVDVWSEGIRGGCMWAPPEADYSRHDLNEVDGAFAQP